MNAPHEEHATAHHGPSLGLTLGIFATLMAMTALTVIVAYQDLGRFSAFAALAIASFKACLVVLYFMHVRYATKLIRLYASAGFFFLAILLGVTMSEVAGRPQQPVADPLRQMDTPAPGSRTEEPP